MTRTITSRLYQPGTRSIDIPAGVNRRFTGISCRLTRENWPAGDNVVTVALERTTDEGQTWQQVGAASFPGGVQIHPRTGQVVTSNYVAFSFYGADGQPIAQAGDTRATFINTVALRTEVTLEAIDD